jgi:membrane protein YdbS with pleckstrin-like domain
MFCIRCGAELTAGAEFCAACGAKKSARTTATVSPQIDDEATVVARLQQQRPQRQESDAPEQIVFSIRPTLLFVKIGYVAAFICSAILAGILLYVGSIAALDVLMWLAVPLALMLLLVPAYYHFRRNLVRYTLTDSKLEIDAGFLSRRTQIVALGKIQDVTISASVWQRIFGYGSLVVDNAAESAVPVLLKNINDPRGHADLMLRQMRRLKN